MIEYTKETTVKTTKQKPITEQYIIETKVSSSNDDEEFEDAIEGLPETTVDNKEEYDLSGRKVGRKAQGVVIRNRKKTISK